MRERKHLVEFDVPLSGVEGTRDADGAVGVTSGLLLELALAAASASDLGLNRLYDVRIAPDTSLAATTDLQVSLSESLAVVVMVEGGRCLLRATAERGPTPEGSEPEFGSLASPDRRAGARAIYQELAELGWRVRGAGRVLQDVSIFQHGVHARFGPSAGVHPGYELSPECLEGVTQVLHLTGQRPHDGLFIRDVRWTPPRARAPGDVQMWTAGDDQLVVQLRDAAGRTIVRLEGLTCGLGPLPQALDTESLSALVKEVLGVRPERPETNLVSLGASSLDLLRVLNGARLSAGVVVDVEAFLAEPTLACLTRLCAAAGGLDAAAPFATYVGDEFPLSAEQEQLWFLERLGSAGAAYNEAVALDVRGRFDVQALDAALRRMVSRHEVLRTVFGEHEGVPFQRVQPHIVVAVVERHLSGVSEQRLTELLSSWARRPFDLERGPLLRAEVAHVGAERHVLLLVGHHLVVDGWSLRQNVLPALQGALGGLPASQVTTGAQYREYVAWQRSEAQQRRTAEAATWWSERLAAHLTELPPLGQQAEAEMAPRAARVGIELDDAALSRLVGSARGHGLTPFSVMMGAYATALARQLGIVEVLVGVPSANRQGPRADALGHCANLLPIPVAIDGESTVEEFVARVHEDVIAALAREFVPFSSLVRLMRVARHATRNPLVQAVISFEDLPVAVDLDGPTRVLRVDTNASKFDMVLHVRQRGEQLACELEYRVDMLTESAARLFARTFAEVLRGMGERWKERLSTVTGVPVAERARLLDLGGKGVLESAGAGPCETLRSNAGHARAAALVASDGTVSWSGLRDRIARAASALRRQGVGPGTLVGVSVPRTSDLVVVLFAVLETGAAYLPVDPELPADRIEAILSDARPACLIVAGAFPHSTAADLPVHDASTLQQMDLDTTTATSEPDPGDLAYVIYTSGSTGRPKGVAIERGNLESFCAAMDTRIELQPQSVWLAVTTVGFDISVLELLWAISRGVTVVLSRGLLRGQDDELWTVGCTEPQRPWLARVTHLQSTPSGARTLIGDGVGRDVLSRLRHLLVGGERLEAELAADLCALVPGKVTNVYGPTEATVWASSHDVVGELRDVPIGRALPHASLYVVDVHDQLVPIGGTGELLIGGAAVARGYLGDPELTAARFAADPFRGNGARVYRTGDRVRVTEDGALEFIGRKDDQLKLRGHRIEPAEVERVVGMQPGVTGCAVIGLPGSAHAMTLTAFVVLEDDQAFDEAAFKGALSTTLPSYMVPHRVLRTGVLPIAASGKVDRRALAVLALANLSAGSDVQAPLDGAERQVSEVWASLLGHRDFGIDDDFFMVGGDSLLAVRLVALLEESLSRVLPLRLIFVHPTIAGITEFLSGDAQDDVLPSQDARHAGVSIRVRTADAGAPDARFDAAAIAVVPGELWSANAGVRAWMTEAAGVPLLFGHIVVEWGRIGVLVLPLRDSSLYTRSEELRHSLRLAIQLTREKGGGHAALTGLIPSATHYGRELGDFVTTGHAATVAAVVTNIEGTLARVGRTIEMEDVALVGVGSIGRAVAVLMVTAVGHPARIVLCDVPGRHERMHSIRQELHAIGYAGEIDVRASGETAPDEVHRCSLIVGATNAVGVLDISRLQPGVIVLDDSAPHCFDVLDATERMHRHADVLVVGGGGVRLPGRSSFELTWRGDDATSVAQIAAASLGLADGGIMGCALASLLPRMSATLVPTIGEPSGDDSLAHLRFFRSAGVGPQAPQLAGAAIPQATLDGFAARHSAPFRSSVANGVVRPRTRGE